MRSAGVCIWSAPLLADCAASLKRRRAHRTLGRMGVVGWILIIKGGLFLFGARHVLAELIAVHPVTFGHVTRGDKGVRKYAANLRVAGYLLALVGAGLAWVFR